MNPPRVKRIRLAVIAPLRCEWPERIPGHVNLLRKGQKSPPVWLEWWGFFVVE
jgi:hypothetical protein